jgi:Leucine-rich repeat (LRR) protein
MFSLNLLIPLFIVTAAAAQSSREVDLQCVLDEDQRGTEEFFTYLTCSLPLDITPDECLTVTSNSLDMAALRHQNKSLKVAFATSQNFPSRLPTSLATHIRGTTHLYYTHSPLEHVQRADFHDLGHRLQLIDLSHNQLRSIPHDAFHDLHSLSYLSVEHNRLQRLEADTFLHAPLLTTLVMRYNEINELHPALFKHAPHFSVLYGEHNRITELGAGLFEGCPHVEIVALRQNRIAKVDVDFRDFKNLSLADFTGNADGCDLMYYNTHPYEAQGYSELELKKWETDLDIFQTNVEENCRE